MHKKTLKLHVFLMHVNLTRNLLQRDPVTGVLRDLKTAGDQSAPRIELGLTLFFRADYGDDEGGGSLIYS